MPNWATTFFAFLLLLALCASSWVVTGALIPPLPPPVEGYVVDMRSLKEAEARLRERTAALEAQYSLSIKLQGGAIAILVTIAISVWGGMLKLRDDRRKVNDAIATFSELETAVRDSAEGVRVLTHTVSQLYCVREGRGECLGPVGE